MSKTLVMWTVALGMVLALLGLFEVTGESVRPSSAGPGLFTDAVEPELPPEAAQDVTLTH